MVHYQHKSRMFNAGHAGTKETGETSYFGLLSEACPGFVIPKNRNTGCMCNGKQ